MQRPQPPWNASMGIQNLFITSSVPVLKVLLVTAFGSFLATDRINILGQDARKHLNRVVYFVFNPALVYTNLSRTITFENVVLLWFMPLNILLIVLIGSALGWIIIKITEPPSHLRGLIFGCCAAGNLGSLPLIIVPAICQEKGSPFGAPDVCHRYGLAYISLSMSMGAIFLWSYVYNIIRMSSTESTGTEESGCPVSTSSHGETSKLLPDTENSMPESILTKGWSEPEQIADQGAEHPTISDDFFRQLKMPLTFDGKKLLKTVSAKCDLRKVLAPSTIGVIVGFAVGLIPQIRKALIGELAPLHVIQDSASLLSDGAIPSVTLIMGGNLMKGIRRSDIRFSLVAGIIVARFIVLPVLGILIVKGAVHFGLVHGDPLYQFILLLQFAVPPALNIGTITQLFGAGESECSIILFWSYGFASVSLTLWSTFFMWLVT